MAKKKTETGKKATPNARTPSAPKKNAIEAPDLETMPEGINRVLNENATPAAGMSRLSLYCRLS